MTQHERMRQVSALAQCGDPDCTEEHGDETDEPTEDFAIYEQSLHSANERMRNRKQ